jgi:hypothetical protein
MLNCQMTYDKAHPKFCKSLSQCIQISVTHLENVQYGRDLVNKSVKLSHDLICRMLISPINLKFMWVEKFMCNVFSNITFDIT